MGSSSDYVLNPVQLIKDVRVPIPVTKSHAKRVDYDYEYERAGTANIFMFRASSNIFGER